MSYRIIGGQYYEIECGEAETLREAAEIAAENAEYWDNWQGWHYPRIEDEDGHVVDFAELYDETETLLAIAGHESGIMCDGINEDLQIGNWTTWGDLRGIVLAREELPSWKGFVEGESVATDETPNGWEREADCPAMRYTVYTQNKLDACGHVLTIVAPEDWE